MIYLSKWRITLCRNFISVSESEKGKKMKGEGNESK